MEQPSVQVPTSLTVGEFRDLVRAALGPTRR